MTPTSKKAYLDGYMNRLADDYAATVHASYRYWLKSSARKSWADTQADFRKLVPSAFKEGFTEGVFTSSPATRAAAPAPPSSCAVRRLVALVLAAITAAIYPWAAGVVLSSPDFLYLTWQSGIFGAVMLVLVIVNISPCSGEKEAQG